MDNYLSDGYLQQRTTQYTQHTASISKLKKHSASGASNETTNEKAHYPPIIVNNIE